MGIGAKTMQALESLKDHSQTLTAAAPILPEPKARPKPPPSSEEQAAIISDAREYALNYTKSLPNFICTQVTRRRAAPGPGSRYARGSEEGQPNYQTIDTLTLRLSYFEQKEDYKLIQVNGSFTTQDYNTIGGATSRGEFGSLLRDIFEPATEARFEWLRWSTLRGQRVMEFEYHVDQAHSQWHINYERRLDLVPAYSGYVAVDPQTHVVMRVTLVAENIPDDFPVKQAATILDYDYTDISGHQFLLPLKAQTNMRADGMLTQNDVEFRLYRKYSTETDIKYDITPDPLPEDKTKEAAPPANTPPAPPANTPPPPPKKKQ
jgi:hypothetical protein